MSACCVHLVCQSVSSTRVFRCLHIYMFMYSMSVSYFPKPVYMYFSYYPFLSFLRLYSILILLIGYKETAVTLPLLPCTFVSCITFVSTPTSSATLSHGSTAVVGRPLHSGVDSHPLWTLERCVAHQFAIEAQPYHTWIAGIGDVIEARRTSGTSRGAVYSKNYKKTIEEICCETLCIPRKGAPFE